MRLVCCAVVRVFWRREVLGVGPRLEGPQQNKLDDAVLLSSLVAGSVVHGQSLGKFMVEQSGRSCEYVFVGLNRL